MGDSLAAVVLAAGAGTRLAPLTSVRPKALCPVGDRPLLDAALDTSERYFQAFQFVVWAGKSAREALDAAMFDTAGEA